MIRWALVVTLLAVGRAESVTASSQEKKEDIQHVEDAWKVGGSKPVIRYIDSIIYTSEQNVYDLYQTKKFEAVLFPQEINAEIVISTISNIEANSDFLNNIKPKEQPTGGMEVISSVKYENLHNVIFQNKTISEILEELNKKSHSNFALLKIESKKIEEYLKQISDLLSYFKEKDISKLASLKKEGNNNDGTGTSFFLNQDDDKFKDLLNAEIAARFILLDRVPRHQPFPEIDIFPLLEAQKIISSYYGKLKDSETEFKYLLFSLDILNKQKSDKFQNKRKELLQQLANLCDAAGEAQKAKLFLSDDPKFTGLGYYGIKNYRMVDQEAQSESSDSQSATDPQ